MASLWNLGGLTYKELAKRVWAQLSEDNILGRSAQLSFYFLLALFPMLLVLISLLSQIILEEAALRGALTQLVGAVAPESASRLVDTALQQFAQGIVGRQISFALLVALWVASSGMVAIINALNLAYEVEETRPWWKRRLVALGLTIGFMLLLVFALAIIVHGAAIAQWVATGLGVAGFSTRAWGFVEGPLALVFVLLVFNLLYLYAPNIKHWDWHWLMPGTVVAVALWFLASYGFQLYVEHFGAYNVVYGSLGAVVVLLLWLYLTGIAILIGAQVNSEIELASNKVGKA